MNIRHAYPIPVLLDRDYVKKVTDSPDSAIHNTFSHFAAFFIVAVTKRFNVDRVYWRHYILLFHIQEYKMKNGSDHTLYIILIYIYII